MSFATDLPAIYHEHDGPTEHRHEHTGPGHYIGESGHYHLTEIFTADELAETLGEVGFDLGGDQ